MDVREVSPKYLLPTLPTDNKRVLTYEGAYDHPVHGRCKARIYRAVRNDNGISFHATVSALKACEPYGVGMWLGDVITFYDHNDNVLEVKC